MDWNESFREGLTVGLSGNPLPAKPRQPVGWLYRGHLLPKIPEEVVYNGEVYSYRLIHRDPDRERTREYSENYTLTCLKAFPATINRDVYRHLIYMKNLGNKAVQLRLNPERTAWGAITPITSNATEVPLTYTVWSEFSMYSSKFDVSIVKEDPVPMYEQEVRHG